MEVILFALGLISVSLAWFLFGCAVALLFFTSTAMDAIAGKHGNMKKIGMIVLLGPIAMVTYFVGWVRGYLDA